MVGVSAEVRAKARVAGGDEVDLDVELDTKPREVVMPPALTKALARDANARKFFEGLSYSNKLRHALPIEQAKTDETRNRRITKSIEMLRNGMK